MALHVIFLIVRTPHLLHLLLRHLLPRHLRLPCPLAVPRRPRCCLSSLPLTPLGNAHEAVRLPVTEIETETETGIETVTETETGIETETVTRTVSVPGSVEELNAIGSVN